MPEREMRIINFIDEPDVFEHVNSGASSHRFVFPQVTGQGAGKLGKPKTWRKHHDLENL
jgi:hypothetical protein